MNRDLVEREDLGVDRDLLYGPKKDRTCTDIFCCLAFAGFWIFSLFIVISSGKKGDLTKIARPYDFDGTLNSDLRQSMWLRHQRN